MPKRPAPYDEGFARFLAERGEQYARLYMETPATADRLIRNPESAMVWWCRQEYDNTAKHREKLRKRIERAREDLEALQLKLAAAEARPASFAKKAPFVALQCAKQHDLEDCDGEWGVCLSCLKFTSDGMRMVKRCFACNVNVCARCIDRYYPSEDMGLQLFIVGRDHMGLVMHRRNLERQKNGRDMIDPERYSERIRRLREEFYDTEQHRADLRAQITEAEACFLAVRAELADAEKRAGMSSFVVWSRRRETGGC